MRRSRCIRIFPSYEEAKHANDILARGGIISAIKEDKFGTLTLEDLGMRARFRLYIQQEDIYYSARFLAKELKK